MKNLDFKDSPEMHVTFELCKDVDVSNLDISASENSPNTDGVHVSGSTNVRVSNSVIRTGNEREQSFNYNSKYNEYQK